MNQSPSLLCIDASEERLALYGRLAAAAGLAPTFCTSEAEALTQLERDASWAVIVVGEALGDADALQVIEQCRTLPRHTSTPIAFVQQQRDPRQARNAMDAGATEIFQSSETAELGDFLSEYTNGNSDGPSYSGKVLLVEDDEVQQVYISALCASLGFQVTCVDEAEKALEAVKNDHFHLLITDVVLRGTKTGIALIRQLRHELGSTLPVIVMSGFDDLPRRLLALRNGIGDFIAKPFAPEEFIWRVHRVLQLVALSEHGEPGDNLDDTARDKRFASLSPREYEICQAVLRGRSDKEIATEFGISYWTVRSHVQQIFSKTGTFNRRELMAQYISRQ